MKKPVILIFGGQSPEYEVSLLSMYNVSRAVDRDKYDVKKIGITKDGRWFLYTGDDEKIKSGQWCGDVSELYPLSIIPHTGFSCEKNGKTEVFGQNATVFPVVHGSYCEDGRLQGLLDMCGLKYVGPGTSASAVCMDKYITKLILNNRDIPQADFVLAHKGMLAKPEKIIAAVEERFSYPVFVKPSNAGSSVGASKVKSREQLIPAVTEAAVIDDKVLIERYIVGREIEVAVMGNDEPFASGCGEINPGSEFYDYNTKYLSDTAKYYIPARLPDDVAERVRAYAVKIYMALGCRGLSRADFFVGEDGNITFNEINTLPGFTSISMYPSLMCHTGMTYSEVIDRLLEYACE